MFKEASMKSRAVRMGERCFRISTEHFLEGLFVTHNDKEAQLWEIGEVDCEFVNNNNK